MLVLRPVPSQPAMLGSQLLPVLVPLPRLRLLPSLVLLLMLLLARLRELVIRPSPVPRHLASQLLKPVKMQPEQLKPKPKH